MEYRQIKDTCGVTHTVEAGSELAANMDRIRTGNHGESDPHIGVFGCNGLEFIGEECDDGVDLDFEVVIRDYMDEHSCDRDAAIESLEFWEGSSTWLIGYRENDQGLYEPDPDADWTATVYTNTLNAVHVERSDWVVKGHTGSPCIPGQIDGDTAGEFWCYAPPADVIGDNEELKARLVHNNHIKHIEAGAKIINRDDYLNNFWGSYYLVYMSAHGPVLLVNAQRHYIAQAHDMAMDYCQSQGLDGLFLSSDEVSEYEADGTIEDYWQGGNEGLYCSSLNIHVEELS